MRRSPIGRFGRRARREAEDLAEFNLIVRTSARWNVGSRAPTYACARCKKIVEHVDCHHLVSKARGGTHDPNNGAALCRPCHHEVHFEAPEDMGKWIRTNHKWILPPRYTQ